MCLFVGLELSWSLKTLETVGVIAREWLIRFMDMHMVSDTIGKRGAKGQCWDINHEWPLL